MISLIPEQGIMLPTGTLKGELLFGDNKKVGITGANGIGKTSFIESLKSRTEIIDRSSFLSQLPLSPLGDQRPIDLFYALKEYSCDRVTSFDSLSQQFNFESLLERPIKQLSGGENQICKIIACLILNSSFYFLDEPTNHLDKDRKTTLTQILKELNTSMLIIDHNREWLNQFCDEIYHINDELIMERV